MKRFAQAVLLFTIMLVTASVGWGQTFQTGDVFVSMRGFGDNDATINWYRSNGTFVKTLDTGQMNTDAVGMAFDASGNLYVTIFQGANVVKFDHSGNLVGPFGSGYSNEGSNDPESILFDIAGNAYVGQADGTRQVLKFSSSGAPLAMFSPVTEDRGTDWIALAADQKTLYYTSEGQLVKRFDLSANEGVGAQLPDFYSGLLGIYAYALRILPDGEVLVADSDRVVRLKDTGDGVVVAQTYLASSLEDVEFPQLFALTLDSDGKSFWTADLSQSTVWKVDLATGAIDQTISISPNTVDAVVTFHEVTTTNTVNLVFGPDPNPQTQIATIGNPGDADAQSLALTLSDVPDPAINVAVSFFYEPTDVSTRTNGVGIADGDCENGATEFTDFDCRFTGTPNFIYQTLLNGDKIVPHIIPSHDNLGVWVRVIATKLDGSPAEALVDYNLNVGDVVEWFYAWNTNPPLAPAPGLDPYTQGWNNLNPQMYDRPGENVDPAFVANITTFSKSCSLTTCVGTADPGTGGKTKTLNDIVIAAPPNPSGTADTVELLVPVPGSSPFPYLKGLPMLVSFELENERTEKSDPNALTLPHSVSVGTLDPTGNPIPVQFPTKFPMTFTYNPFLKIYYIYLSPAPYKLYDGTPNTVYTLQIDSDLFPQPVNVKFVVKKSLF